MSSQYILNVFVELLEIETQKNADREVIMNNLAELQRVAEQNNYNIDILTKYLQQLERKNEIKIVKVPQYYIQNNNQYQYKDMINGNLYQILIIGMIMNDSQFIGVKFERMNNMMDLIKSRNNGNVDNMIEYLNNNEQRELEYEYKNVHQHLIQSSIQNEHLIMIMNQNNINNYEISKSIQFLYLIQQYIQITIQVILIVNPNTSEQKILSFNSQQQQDKSMTILIELNLKIVNYNLLINEISNKNTSLLQSCSLAKQLTKQLDLNTQKLKSIYQLQSLEDNNLVKESINQSIKQKVFGKKVFSRQHSYQHIESSIRKRSVSPLIRNRECMRCKKVFQVDLKNLQSQISHFCQECKSNYFSTNI